MIKRITAVMLAILCMLMPLSAALAADIQQSDLTVVLEIGSEPQVGVGVEIYQVAEMRRARNGELILDATPAFAGGRRLHGPG